MDKDGKKIYSVSELNREIKVVLEDAYPDVWVEGEVSNFKIYSSGHAYFSLKDEEAQISAVLFAGAGKFFKFKIEDGQKFIVRGRVSSYPKRGEYQLIVSCMEPSGKGALQLAFEQLKARLEKEGLFDQCRKRPIPILPQKIGIVTSPTGAAIRDIFSVINRRFANVEILFFPVRVQGDEAKGEIAFAVKYLNEHFPGLDVLLVGRGGGSYEDLWAFNEEIVARAIAESKIPVISCVGHEIDFTIADFVADLRAATPSAAAELVVKNKSELTDRISSYDARIKSRMNLVLNHLAEKIDMLSTSRALTRPTELIEERLQEIDEIHDKLKYLLKHKVELLQKDWENSAGKLNLLSPLNILSRGYAIAWKADDNKLIKVASELSRGEVVKVRLHKGGFSATVEDING